MGGFSVGGLISGLDSNSIISQLIAIERQPVRRIQTRVAGLQTQQTKLRELRTKLLALRNLMKDFQLGTKFKDFAAPSSNASVLTATAGGSPTQGTFSIEVIQLATATVANSSARLGAAINPGASLATSGIPQISSGTFSVNGVQFTVNPSTDSLNSVLSAINASAAGVTATYSAVTDKVTFTNTTGGDTAVINFGATGDTSNLLAVLGVENALQSTGGTGSTTVTGNNILGAVETAANLNTVSFAGGAVTAGNFRINGVTITVDPTNDTLGDILAQINGSDAGVRATYDGSTDTIRVVSKNLGSRTISFQAGTSNFLAVTNLATATQTAGIDSQYRVDGGAVQTNNSNSVTSAISGVTLNFLSAGTSSVTVAPDVDKILETVTSFVTAFNESIGALNELTKEDGALENDGSIRSIESFLRSNIFNRVTGLPGQVETLLDIGVSTGASFDQTAVFHLELDEAKLRDAIVNNRDGVESLFTNTNDTGVVDTMFDFLEAATSTTGYLNERSRAGGSIDTQITGFNDRIAALERGIALREARLRRQFLQLETLTSSLQAQGASLGGLVTQGNNR